jgi:hypothetical protein
MPTNFIIPGLEIVKILIENGAKVDLEVDPVHLAFSQSAFDVGQYLIGKCRKLY